MQCFVNLTKAGKMNRFFQDEQTKQKENTNPKGMTERAENEQAKRETGNTGNGI